ncbi:transglutaminaseTgpA domain-containing protein [Blastococcus capsensis]|uniref:transglutaminase family protein n=1 Tax=Blastococcus capsensis TaxID=1564163 RepID=UPI00253F892A|nr:transglutaminaseTgpA domain-containing protein [Blastococcus capsensis]MDK3255991.1 transglutaminaseTgpA domain-containing protein [Blastococcus capsensis]
MINADVRTSVLAALATLLGSLALSPVFTSGAWFPPVLAVVAAVLAGGLVLRRAAAHLTRSPTAPRAVGAVSTLLVPVGQLLLVACVLTAAFAPDGAVAGLLPTTESLTRLAGVFADGTAEIREQATPALPLTGLLALTTLFVGLLAVLVDLVAVAGRQAAAAGVGLLVLFCVPVGTVIGGIGLLALAAPAAGFAVLLWADQRRALGESAAERVSGGSGPAVRVGIVALSAGVLLGGLVPVLPEGSFATGLGGGGDATGTALDPAAELRGQLILPEPIELLRLDSSVADPGYLRAVALDEYDAAEGWSLSNLDGEVSIAEDSALAPLPGRQATRPVTADVQVLEHDDRFLPVPSSPLSVRVDGEYVDGWRFDDATGTVFGRDVTSAGLAYRVIATEPRPSPELLSRAVPLSQGSGLQDRFTALPELHPSIAELTARLTAGATTPYEAVRRIQAYLSDRANGFVYSLSTAPGTSGDDLVDFLRLKRGYCEQYAGAMAVLVRQAGMPARVALGYTPGEVQDDGTRLITSDDAHAWVEVFFRGLGWVPFDPTPIAADRQVPLPWSPRPSAEADDEVAPALPVPSAAPQAPLRGVDPLAEATPEAGAQVGSATSRRPLLLTLGLLAAAAGVLASPAALRALQRRRRLAAPDATGPWDELTATAADLGLHVHPSWTPRRVADALALAVTRGRGGASAAASVEAVRGLARAEEAATYGRPGSGAADPGLRGALRTARRGLVGARPWPVRVRALLWPASLVDGARAKLARRPRNVTGRRP